MLIIFSLLLLYFSHFLKCDSDYDGPLTIKLFHNLEEPPNSKGWCPCAHITLKNVNTGSVKVKLLDWNTTTSSKLLTLGRKDKLYRLKALVLTSKGRKIVYRTFCKARKLIFDNATPTLTITLDYTGTIMGINIQDASFISEDRMTAQSPVVNPTVIVRATELGPAPDTATYIQKLEREREAKERGANMDNRSFFAKYWMYILLVIVVAVLSGSSNNEQAQNAR
ncbi:ER membrane protein complex subunit 10 [Rhodnius prolixus]|uniref:ER membrane protein complex subunit 10 n=1 Tax=Rhodnius prolixus TaxID=13249 RepID=T1HLS7_RHOPR